MRFFDLLNVFISSAPSKESRAKLVELRKYLEKDKWKHARLLIDDLSSNTSDEDRYFLSPLLNQGRKLLKEVPLSPEVKIRLNTPYGHVEATIVTIVPGGVMGRRTSGIAAFMPYNRIEGGKKKILKLAEEYPELVRAERTDK